MSSRSTRAFSPSSGRPSETGLPLEIASLRLLPLDGQEQLLEVPQPEPPGPTTLDELVEHGRPVLDVLREDLEQVALLVPVGQDVQPLHVVPALLDGPDVLADALVVGLRHADEPDPAA